ncbi:MAG: biosynthetic-type acetolactate synthase large subunit [Planctomycetes bacterium]|nr:biosynthetic-type acetolactate synthase large subunit [Planctomycetota bacterium]
MTGAQILVEGLKAAGVEVMFGYPGGSVIPIFDVLYEEKSIKFVLTRHEQGAGHAADGYARATGKPGCVIATSGPGATNLITAIANAYMDSVPMVAITGQVKTMLIGNDAFQEADVTGITRPITKHNYLVKDVNDLARVVKEAFHIASTGRPGPVVIDLPVDVTQQKTRLPKKVEIDLPGYKPTYEGHPQQVQRAAELINKAERPVLYVGGGVIISEASEEVFEIATKAHIPVTTTLMGLGAFPEEHPLSLQMLGMHGTVYANYAVTNCDLLIAVGARFDDRVTGKLDAFAPNAKVVHIDIDPSAISKNVHVDMPIVGDCKKVLKELKEHIKPNEREAWVRTVAEWKEKYPLSYPQDGKLHPQMVVEKLHEVTGGDAIIVTDVGQNQMWAAQFYRYSKPRTFISSGGLGTMGYGFPAAIGAQVGMPDRKVALVSGDGSIQMNIQELATAHRLDLPIVIVLLNNGYLGMVRQWQELFFARRYSHTTLEANPDFVKLVEAYGAKGMRVDRAGDVEQALREAFDARTLTLIDFVVEPEANVFPMVPSGEAIDRMIGGMA